MALRTVCFNAKLKTVNFNMIFLLQRAYDVIVPPVTINIDCYKSNVIFSITKNNFLLGYFSEKAQNERFNKRKNCFAHPKKHGYCRIFIEHITEIKNKRELLDN